MEGERIVGLNGTVCRVETSTSENEREDIVYLTDNRRRKKRRTDCVIQRAGKHEQENIIQSTDKRKGKKL